MTHSTTIRKVYQGVADRRQLVRMSDRHRQRSKPRGDEAALYAGEWFEISEVDYDYLLEILPPLWMRYDMFAMRDCITGKVTSVLMSLWIDGRARWFHAYCDLADPACPDRTKAAIIERESRPVCAMTREERIEHIWSSTHDEYRGYSDWRFPREHRGERIVIVYGPTRSHDFKLLDQLTDDEIAAKLPVHLRHLPDSIAA